MSLIRLSTLVLTVCAWLCTTQASRATVSGGIVPIPPPASLLPGEVESDTEIFLIAEQASYILSADVFVDIDGTPGLYDQPFDAIPGVVPVGSLVDIHLLHFDPVGQPGSPVRQVGSVSFGRPIVGLAFRPNTLNASDIHGAPGTVYPLGSNRNFEFGTPGTGVSDSVEISLDRRKLSVDWGATQFFDQLRVFTAVPEPAGMLIGAVAGTWLMLFARRAGNCRPGV